MPEEEAFCALVQLMKHYSFRELYTHDMVGLHMRLYQFDCLLKEMEPQIASHLESHGILSTMFASQWFMTVFAVRILYFLSVSIGSLSRSSSIFWI
jgi:hypothetical protein